METLTALPYSELKRLAEDEEYADDFRMTTPGYTAMCRKKDILEDKALKLAKENIQDAEDLEGEYQIYSETVLPNYQEQKDKAAAFVE